MDAEKFTRKSLEMIENCEKLAYEYSHQEIGQEHLLYSLLTVEDSLIAKLLNNMGMDVQSISNACERLLAARPKVSGGKLYTNQGFSKTLIQAEKEAKQMKDSFISVEHLFLGILESMEPSVKDIIKQFHITRNAFLQALADVRGNHRVDNDNPEATYDTLEKYGYKPCQ